MSLTVSVEEVKERFEELVGDAARRHEEIVVVKNGASLARVTPFGPSEVESPRLAGIDQGKFTIPPEFYEPLPNDMLDAFEGKA